MRLHFFVGLVKNMSVVNAAQLYRRSSSILQSAQSKQLGYIHPFIPRSPSYFLWETLERVQEDCQEKNMCSSDRQKSRMRERERKKRKEIVLRKKCRENCGDWEWSLKNEVCHFLSLSRRCADSLQADHHNRPHAAVLTLCWKAPYSRMMLMTGSRYICTVNAG